MTLSLIIVMCIFSAAFGWFCGCRSTKFDHKVDGDIIITHNEDGDIELTGMTIATDIPVLIGQRELVLKIDLERASD